MRRNCLTLLTIMIAAATAGAVTLENQSQKTGYAIGADLGNNLFQFNTEENQLVDFDAVVVGLRDAYEKRSLSMTEEDMHLALMKFSTDAEAAMKQKLNDMQAKVADESKAFLEENASKEGVQTTESGLQYLVVEEGDGKTPTAESQVQVTYEGRLIDGTVFDSSDEPVTFGVNEVIDGWVEGIQLMKEGSKYTFFIPSDLAYGDVGQPAAGILPGAALVFDVTLIKIVDAEEGGSAVESATEEPVDAAATVEAPETTTEAAAEENGQKAAEEAPADAATNEVEAVEEKADAAPAEEAATEATNESETATAEAVSAEDGQKAATEEANESSEEVAPADVAENEVATMAENAAPAEETATAEAVSEEGEQPATEAEALVDAAANEVAAVEEQVAAVKESVTEEADAAANEVATMAENAVSAQEPAADKE